MSAIKSFFKWCAIIFGGVVFMIVIGANSTPTTPAAAKPTKSPAEEKEYAREQGAVFGAIKQLVTHARDPRSVTVYNAVYIKGACVEYGARNGFGGMNKEFIVGVVTGDNVSFRTDVASWNKYCVGSGNDHNYFAKRTVDALIKRI